MHHTDEMIRTGLRRAVAQGRPAGDLWERVERGIGRRRPPLLKYAVAAVIVALMATAALPGARAAAGEVMRAIFSETVGDMPVQVREGKVPFVGSDVKFAEATSDGGPVTVVSVGTQAARRFTGGPGQFPAEARAAIRAPFRIPATIPADQPVEVVVQAHADSGQEFVTMFIGGAMISQRTPAPEDLNILVLPGAKAQTMEISGVEVLEIEDAGRILYTFRFDGVLADVSGSSREKEMVRSLVEALLH
ncbi:MAG: hypothetical protein ACOY94_09750 [Bacillota bacterium]